MKPIHWRRSRFGKYLRHMPRVKNIRGTWLHRRLGDRLFRSDLWHPTRRRFAAGFAVGAFFALMPAPFQMLAAGLIAYITRVNVPAAIAGTWISNPFTFPICVYAQYRLGCLIIGSGISGVPTHDVWEILKKAPVPVLVGAFPAAAILAVIMYPLTLFIWDVVTARLAARRKIRESAGL
ncbi:MAG: DUF2062 domain-containing protein [Terrimicrobiaceae bacterium]|jgi:hypothetical protein|nr:DUF2062 domain-containing protein [Terrimicrobiaceae bacterium]